MIVSNYAIYSLEKNIIRIYLSQKVVEADEGEKKKLPLLEKQNQNLWDVFGPCWKDEKAARTTKPVAIAKIKAVTRRKMRGNGEETIQVEILEMVEEPPKNWCILFMRFDVFSIFE